MFLYYIVKEKSMYFFIGQMTLNQLWKPVVRVTASRHPGFDRRSWRSTCVQTTRQTDTHLYTHEVSVSRGGFSLKSAPWRERGQHKSAGVRTTDTCGSLSAHTGRHTLRLIGRYSLWKAGWLAARWRGSQEQEQRVEALGTVQGHQSHVAKPHLDLIILMDEIYFFINKLCNK